MKYFISFIILLISFSVNAQTIKYRMIDFTPFKFPAEITFWSALDSNKVEFDSLKSHCNTIYTIDITNNVFSYVGVNGDSWSGKMIDFTKTEFALMLEVSIGNIGTYHYLFGKNVIGDTSLIIRKKEVVNGKVEGFFTNKVELIK
jgi:hypothetical protein